MINCGDILVLLVVGILVCVIIGKMVRDQKKGNHCGGCKGCSMESGCSACAMKQQCGSCRK